MNLELLREVAAILAANPDLFGYADAEPHAVTMAKAFGNQRELFSTCSRAMQGSVNDTLALAEYANVPWAESLRRATDDAIRAAVERADNFNVTASRFDLSIHFLRRIVDAAITQAERG